MKDGFNEYESHIDNLITQYKSQLEQIKNNRENKENSMKKCISKNNIVQESSSHDNENISNNKILRNYVDIPSNACFTKSDCYSNPIRKNSKEEIQLVLNKAVEDKDKKYSTLIRQEDVKENKINSANSNHSENNELKRKINLLNEENFRLSRNINDLIKQNEKFNDILIRNERLQNELNILNESESILKNELENLKSKCDIYEHKSHKFAEIELKSNEENSKMKYKINEIERFYEDEIKYKDEQITSLKNETISKYEHELMSYRILVEKINLFLKNNLCNIKDSNANIDYKNDNYTFKTTEYESHFKSIENYLYKLKYDNTELVKYINTRLNRANKEDMNSTASIGKIEKLNEINNDLKIENSLLKHQINNLVDEQTSKQDISRVSAKPNDNFKQYNYHLKKKVNKESIDKNSNSYNSSRVMTPLKINKKKLQEDSRSNCDSEVSFCKDNKSNKSKISEFSRKERSNEIEYRNDNFRERNQLYNMTPVKKKDNELEFVGASNNFHPDLERKIKNNNPEVVKYYPNEMDDLINMKSPKNFKADFTLSKDLNQLEGLKHRIKDLENKLVEINTDDKEKQIIDSIREYRNKNISSPDNKKYY